MLPYPILISYLTWGHITIISKRHILKHHTPVLPNYVILSYYAISDEGLRVPLLRHLRERLDRSRPRRLSLCPSLSLSFPLSVSLSLSIYLLLSLSIYIYIYIYLSLSPSLHLIYHT